MGKWVVKVSILQLQHQMPRAKWKAYSETYSDRQFTLNTRKGLRKHKMPKIVFERDWKHREQ